MNLLGHILLNENSNSNESTTILLDELSSAEGKVQFFTLKNFSYFSLFKKIILTKHHQ